MSNTTQYNSPIASINIDENGIFIFNLKDTYTSYDGNEARKQFDFFRDNSNGQPYKVLVDSSNSVNIPTEKAVLVFKKQNKPEYKFAIYVTNLPIQIYVGQLSKYNKYHNVKLFKSKEKAIKWLISS